MWKQITLKPETREEPLRPDDFDRALRQMKNDLALLGLRRQLLERDLDAGAVLALTEQILSLQRSV